MSPSAIVQKLWNYFNVLRDDGISYSDYVELGQSVCEACGLSVEVRRRESKVDGVTSVPFFDLV